MRRVVRRMQPTGTNMWMYYDSNEPHSGMGFDDLGEAIAHAKAQYGPDVYWMCEVTDQRQKVCTLWSCEDDALAPDFRELAVAEVRKGGAA
jgi:hypothetical protein